MDTTTTDARILYARARVRELTEMIEGTDDILKLMTYSTLRRALVGVLDAYEEVRS